MTHLGFQRYLVALLITAFVCATGCSGQSANSDSAQEVETPGTGRYDRIIVNLGIVVSDSSIQATIPSKVSVGQIIEVSFVKDGQEITDSWQVVRISTKGTLCRLHNARDRTVGNTVYVKPCRILR
jgi:hypothetical protein